MRFRTIALSLALTFGLSAVGEAKVKHPKTTKHSVAHVNGGRVKPHKATKLKARKMKVARRHVKR